MAMRLQVTGPFVAKVCAAASHTGPVKKATTPALSDCSFDGEKPQPGNSHLNVTEGPHSALPKSFSPLRQGWVFWTRLNLQPGYRFRINVRTGRETKQELLTGSFEGAAGGRGRLQKVCITTGGECRHRTLPVQLE